MTDADANIDPVPSTASAQTRTVRVDLGERSYVVAVGSELLEFAGMLVRERLGTKPRRAFVVVDSGVSAADRQRLLAGFASVSLDATVHELRATEHDKSLATIQKLCESMTKARVERTDVVIALGGGIVGDVAGFAASAYRRGVAVVQCPTTLLSMVDASVGGKTGVNLELSGTLKKNMVGAFHQPIGVLADLATLATLDDRTFRAGLAECVKHAMLSAEFGDPDLMAWTQTAAGALAARETAALCELIARNVAIKARVVAGDEREEAEGTTGRALLNLGHTFGHAIEALPDARGMRADGTELPGAIHHGEAVALGLRAACALGESLGLDRGYANSVLALLDQLALPRAAKGLPATDEILARMADDKKSVSGVLRLIVPAAPGRSVIRSDIPAPAVRSAIESIRSV
ncbi:MAG: 3-dehydroquinate synthase [Phycisphaerales bacterium]|nr:3-dehydroquinate synthase [Phycisphaerales bacterium]